MDSFEVFAKEQTTTAPALLASLGSGNWLLGGLNLCCVLQEMGAYPKTPIIMEVENYTNLKETNLGGTIFFHFHDCGRKSIDLLILYGEKTCQASFLIGLHTCKVRSRCPRLHEASSELGSTRQGRQVDLDLSFFWGRVMRAMKKTRLFRVYRG